MVTRDSLEQLREQYVEERPKYGELASHVAATLGGRLRPLVPTAQITHRPKAVDRLIKKAIVKQYADPETEIRDRAGVRVIVTYADELDVVDESVTSLFYVVNREDKREEIDDQSLAYRGTHFEVTLTEEQVSDVGDDWFEGKLCEIQLQTQAENLWAGVSHELLYKPFADLSSSAKRSIYRLVALVEIFDSEVTGARSELRSQGMVEFAQALDDLEHRYYQFTARESDRQLSYLVLTGLKEHLDEDEMGDVLGSLQGFVEENREKLSELYATYRHDDRSSPLLHQAEALLLFSLLEQDAFALRDAWAHLLPSGLLEELATVWGVVLED